MGRKANRDSGQLKQSRQSDPTESQIPESLPGAATGRKSRRQFIREAAVVGAGIVAAPYLAGESAEAAFTPPGPPLSNVPGSPRPWMPSFALYSGVANLASGNYQFAQPICGWAGKGGGIQLTLYHNNQSSRSSALGAKWSHSYYWKVTGTNPAIVIAGDGTETSFTLTGGVYVAPTGVYDTLVKNGDNTWTFTTKNGLKYNFDTSGQLSTIVDLNGNTVTCTWSGGNLTSVQDAAGRTLTLTHASGKLTSITDTESRVWSLAYDTSNRVKTITDPTLNGNSYTTQFTYNTSNYIVTVTNRLGKIWTFGYTSAWVNGITDPDTKTMGISYSVPGTGWPTGTSSMATGTDSNSNTVKYGMDANGAKLGERDGLGNQTNFGYDSSLNVTSRTLPSGVAWGYTYDSKANQLTETDPNNKTTTRTFDSGNRLLTVTDPLNHVWTNTYDTHGNKLTEKDPLNNQTSYSYNGDGTVATVTDPASKITSMAYDAYSNLTLVTDPLNHQTSFSWTNTKMTSRTDGVGRTTNYTYDAWGRLTGIDYPVGGSTDISYTYDAEGRLTQAVDGTGTRNYTYDTWGRKLTLSDPRGTTTAVYDSGGRLTSQTDASGRLNQYQYGASNLLSQANDPTTTATYSYTVDGNVALEVYPNGTQKEISYDSVRRISLITHRIISTQAVIVSYTPTYDDAGRITQIVEQPSGDTTSFTYDNAGRILTENRTGTKPYTSTYTYDSRGNRLTAIRTENGVTSHNGTYSYDDSGRLTQCVDTATGLTETYTWNNDNTLASSPGSGYTRLYEYDEEQRLIRIKKDFGGGNVQTVYEYGYAFDGGRRWRKDYGASVWTWYPCGVACCAGDLVEMTSDLTGNVWTTSALYLKGLSIVRRNSEYHHFDLFGVAALITDGAGAQLSSSLYDAFGASRYANGTAASPWRWSQSADEGLVSMGQQHYLPSRSLGFQSPAVGVPQGKANKKQPDIAVCPVPVSAARDAGAIGAYAAQKKKKCGVKCYDPKGNGSNQCTTPANICQKCCDKMCPKHDPKMGSPWCDCYNACDNY